jgi:hypothetical protein
MSVICYHNAGFFSCCTIKLGQIINYINNNLKFPDLVDSSHQFNWYKECQYEDITFNYFQHYDNINKTLNKKFPILNVNVNNNYISEYQFSVYQLIDFDRINPVITKYFSPSNNILNIIQDMEKKYNIDYNNICVLFYRGNDKNQETIICDYSEYLAYANKILKINPGILFLIQSDETEFINFISERFPNNSFYFNNEIRHIPKCNSTVDIILKDKNPIFSKYYLAITIIMSKCKYIICGSGNCSFWIILYRGNNNNVIQNLNNKWYYNI